MAFIFEHSCLVAKSELDLFSNLPTNACCDEGITIEHLPSTALDSHSPIKFLVSRDSNYYTDLSSSYLLYTEVKITKADRTDIDNHSTVGPINLLGQSLIQQVDMHLNDILATDASNLYHYRSLLETVLSFGTEAKKSQLTIGLYYKDTPGHMNAINDSNTGLKARKSFTNEGNVVPMIGRIHSDMFFQNRIGICSMVLTYALSCSEIRIHWYWWLPMVQLLS